MLTPESKTELLDLIDTLANLEKERTRLRQQELGSRDRLSLLRAKKLIEITFARDDKDKPLYSNESVREAALLIFLDKEPEYCTLKDEVRQLGMKYQELSIEHQRLSDRKTLLLFAAGLTTSPHDPGALTDI